MSAGAHAVRYGSARAQAVVRCCRECLLFRARLGKIEGRA